MKVVQKLEKKNKMETDFKIYSQKILRDYFKNKF